MPVDMNATRLMRAVRVGDVEAAEAALAEIRGPVQSRVEVHEALCEVARCGNSDVLRLLLRNKADVTYTDKAGKKPIHYAAQQGIVELVRMIISAGSPVNVADITGASPLHYAVQIGSSDMTLLLLSEGASTNRAKTYMNSETPLHFAARLGRTEICKFLLAKGADVNLMTLDKQTTLQLAIKQKNDGVVRLLARWPETNLRQCNGRGQTALHIVTEQSSEVMLHLLLDLGGVKRMDVSGRDNSRRSALHYAASYSEPFESHLKIATILIEHGAEISTGDSEALTPLHFAALSGNTGIGELLLEHKANINAIEKISGDTPLNMAIGHNKKDMVELLIRYGADVTLPDASLTTPLHRVQGTRGSQKCAVTDILLRHGAKVNVSSDRGYTPMDCCVFHSAIGGFSATSMMRLVAAGACLRQRHPPHGRQHRNSPLCWLTWHNKLRCARYLVDAGWDLHGETWIQLQGKTAEIEVFMGWLREVASNPRPLRQLCRTAIRAHLSKVAEDGDILPFVERLPLPAFLVQLVQLEPESKAFGNNDQSGN